MAGHERYSINDASAQELEHIPGVDHGMAETILEFRDRRGWIHNLEELTDVQQIPSEEMGQLREWLTVASERSGALDYEGQKEEPDIV
ncbi:MAG: helix-hairpin-helix domain-containing protein [Phycisphaerales bacterium]